MKKKIFSMALLAMSLVALPSVAKSAPAENGQCTKTECTASKDKKAKCDKKVKCDKKQNCAADSTKCAKVKKGQKGQRPDAFAGLNINEEQKAKLQALNEQRRADFKQKAQEGKQMRAQKDSVKRADRIASKKAYLDQVKAIVGPEEYVVFLENFYVNAPQQHKAKAFKQGDKGRKGDMAKGRKDRRDDNRGPKGQKGAKAQK